MSSSLQDPLFRAATLTFEELTLLYAIPQAEPPQAAPEAEVAVGFEGPLQGRLLVRTYGGLLPLLAANMLGHDTPPAPSLQLDALGEVANVICGNLLPAIGGAHATFRLQAPVPGGVPARPDSFPELPVASVALELDPGHAQVLLYLDADGGTGA